MRNYYILIFILILVLSSCATEDAISPTATAVMVVSSSMPTAIFEQNPTQVVEKIENERPTPAPVCTNSLWFLSDLTIPDGTVVVPGERLDKRWEVRNNGTCNWNEGYQVKLIAGPGMGLPVQQALFPALSDTDIVIRMVFIAPKEPGTYRSAWQAYDPQDIPFGDPFFIDIVVPEESGG